jgi:hypothetical protein
VQSIKLIFVAFLLTVSSASAQSVIDDQARRPPPLEPPPTCELWRGAARGNDPSQVIEMILCVEGSSVRGTFQTSSLNSGWSKRTFVGTVIEAGQRLSLREVVFVDNRPRPGWRFCLIDQYDLRFTSATHLESDYHSSACEDNGHISADRVVGTDGAVTTQELSDAGWPARTELTAERPRVILVSPVESTRRRWLSCSVPTLGSQRFDCWITVVFAVLVARRRLPRLRLRASLH